MLGKVELDLAFVGDNDEKIRLGPNVTDIVKSLNLGCWAQEGAAGHLSRAGAQRGQRRNMSVPLPQIMSIPRALCSF